MAKDSFGQIRVWCLCVLVTIPAWIWGQTPAQWYDIGGDWGLPGPFSLGMEATHRRSLGRADNSFLEAKFSWKADKHWDFSLGYRYIAEGDLLRVDHLGHRYQFDAAFDDKIGEWKIKARFRHQFKHTDVFSDALGWLPERTSRLKLSGSINLAKGWDLDLGGEVFVPQGARAAATAWRLDEYRLFARIERRLNKWADARVRFLWDAPWNAPASEGNAIWNAGLKFDLDKAMKVWRKQRK